MTGPLRSLPLTDCMTNGTISASLVPLSHEVAQLINQNWWCSLGTFESRCHDDARQPILENGHLLCRSRIPVPECLGEEDRDWNWVKVFEECGDQPLVFECLALQTADKGIQGAIVYRWDEASLLEEGERAVFVELLATAPQNRIRLVPDPMYAGIGKGLLLTAIRHSYGLGLKGRIQLYAAPGAINFYISKFNFVDTGLQGTDEDNGQKYRIFELPSSSALNVLRRAGLLRD
jgi:hypothetical protein